MGVRIDEARVALALEAAGLTLDPDALACLLTILRGEEAWTTVSALRDAGADPDTLVMMGLAETFRDEDKRRAVTLTAFGEWACGVSLEDRWRLVPRGKPKGKRRERWRFIDPRRWVEALMWVHEPGRASDDSRPAGEDRAARSMPLPEWLADLQVDAAPGPVECAECAEEFVRRHVTTETGQLAVDPETGRVLESPLILLGGPVRAPKARGWGKPNRTAKPVKVTRKERRRALAGAGV